MNSNTVNSADQTVLPSADQTVLPSADQTVLPAETKKKPVLKTIPKKIMGYLKFAHFVLGSNDDTIVSKLFLDKSIDQIVAIVNDVVENGNQDKTINDLRKLIFNPPKLKNPKKTKKADNADAIVTDLVTLARTDDTPAVPNKTRANKSTTTTTDTPTEPVKKSTTKKVVDTTVVPVKKSRTKKVAETVAETVGEPVAEPVAETVAEPVAEPVKKSRTKKVVEKKPTKTKAPVKPPMKSSDIAPPNYIVDPNEVSCDDSCDDL